MSRDREGAVYYSPWKPLPHGRGSLIDQAVAGLLHERVAAGIAAVDQIHLTGIDAALEAGLSPVKLNMVVVRGVNDEDIVALRSSTVFRDVKERDYLETHMYRDAGHGLDIVDWIMEPGSDKEYRSHALS